MNSEATPVSAPKLRFPQFQDGAGWEARPLGLFAHLNTEKAGDAECVPMSITSGVGLVNQMEKFGRVIAGDSYRNYLLLKKNDFAYNKSATKQYPEGFIALYTGDAPAAIPNSIFTSFHLKDDSTLPEYLNFLFLSNLHGQWLRKFIKVGARAHGSLSVSDADLLALPIPLPCGPLSRAEQAKIAECLSTLDELIDAEIEKLEALNGHKKGLMQQLFPREGEAHPRLRFPEFQSRPGWTTKIGGQLFVNRKEAGEAGLPIYSVTVNDGMVPRASFDRDFYDIQDPAGNKKACRGDIAYNMMRMWQGAQGVAPEDCLVSPAYVVLAPQEGVCAEFFAYYFKLPQTLELLAATSRGLTKDRLRLYFDDFARMRMLAPELDEQKRIADCLSRLDELVDAQRVRLESLRNLKQGLMQQLFPLHAETEDRRHALG